MVRPSTPAKGNQKGTIGLTTATYQAIHSERLVKVESNKTRQLCTAFGLVSKTNSYLTVKKIVLWTNLVVTEGTTCDGYTSLLKHLQALNKTRLHPINPVVQVRTIQGFFPKGLGS